MVKKVLTAARKHRASPDQNRNRNAVDVAAASHREAPHGDRDTMFDAAFAPMQGALDTVPLRELEPLREPGAFGALVREIGEDGAGEVRAVFWSDTSSRLKLFRTLELGQHRARIGREAHSLKSAARTFGYLRLAALALRLEGTADTLDDADFSDLLQQMDEAFTAAKAQESQG